MFESVEDLKVGDRVVVTNTSGVEKIGTVERVTKTLVIVGRYRFKKSNGTCKVGTYQFMTLRPATEEDVRKLGTEDKRRKDIAYISSIDWSKISDETIAKIKALVSDVNNKNKNQ